jgi:hypothetical protein
MPLPRNDWDAMVDPERCRWLPAIIATLESSDLMAGKVKTEGFSRATVATAASQRRPAFLISSCL